jgi:hypothetical protein
MYAEEILMTIRLRVLKDRLNYLVTVVEKVKDMQVDGRVGG